jgi:membrane fusion protein (multidrug efflux system)
VDKTPLNPAVVFTKKVSSEQIYDSLTYPARASAKVNATILSESNGIISQMAATLGQKVRVGQIIMVLRHTDPVYQYAPVKILAPLSGIVSSIDVTPGSHVIEGQALAAVINPSEIEILVEIPAQDLSSIKKGTNGLLTTSVEGELLKVEVLGVSPLVKPGTGTASAKLRILPPQGKTLAPGMQGQVSFKTDLHSGFLIPNNAIVYRGKVTFVNLVESKKIKQVSVELGKRHRDCVEILKGLYENAELVERSSRSVADGETITTEAVSTAPQENL